MILEFEMKKQNIRIKTSFAWFFSSLFSRFEYVQKIESLQIIYLPLRGFHLAQPFSIIVYVSFFSIGFFQLFRLHTRKKTIFLFYFFFSSNHVIAYKLITFSDALFYIVTKITDSLIHDVNQKKKKNVSLKLFGGSKVGSPKSTNQLLILQVRNKFL